MPWTVLGDPENDDFPRSHVVPGTVLGDTKTTIFRGATSCLGRFSGTPENDDFPRSHVVPGAVLGTHPNDDFPRSHVVPWTFLGDPGNDDFPRSHVVPGTVLGTPKRRFSEEPRRALGGFGRHVVPWTFSCIGQSLGGKWTFNSRL